mgnify:CR=1 FL=1
MTIELLTAPLPRGSLIPSSYSDAEIEAESRRLQRVIKQPVKWNLSTCRAIAPLTLEINQLKRENDVFLIAHSYQTPDIIYGVADSVADSYALSKEARDAPQQTILFSSVRFMAETLYSEATDETIDRVKHGSGMMVTMTKGQGEVFHAGTTNWEAAQNPSEHLKTIVPISGSIGVQQMFYRNGSSESRAMLYDVLYEGATTDPTEDDMRMCSDDIIGPISPFTTWVGAGMGGDQWNDYWDERYHLQDVLDNYEGSVYLVWGLQDWNVDPYHAFPTYRMLNDAGIHTRAFIGQWAHNYPDQPDRHGTLGSGYGAEAFPNMSRMDWAIELYNWFNYYLKDFGPEPEAIVQIQTNDGHWHAEDTWPPDDMTWEKVTLDAADSTGGWVSATATSSFTIAPFEDDIHISGLPTLHLSVNSPAIPCNGGQVFATMFDDETGLRLGHATMDLRYRDGGYGANAVLPGQNYLMLMEFNPMDVVLPAGHAIRVDLTESGEDYLPSPCAVTGIGVSLDESSEIGLPLIDRPAGDSHWFVVPQLELESG